MMNDGFCVSSRAEYVDSHADKETSPEAVKNAKVLRQYKMLGSLGHFHQGSARRSELGDHL